MREGLGERAGVAKRSRRRRQRDPRGSRRMEPARPRRDETRRRAALKQQENENMDFVCVYACIYIFYIEGVAEPRIGPRPLQVGRVSSIVSPRILTPIPTHSRTSC